MLAAEPDLADLIGSDGAGDGAAEADWLAAAHPLLEAYFAMEDPRRLEPADRELHVQALVGDGEELLLRGYVDRLDVSPDGQIRVVDYKTGRAPKAGYENKPMFQMRFYALAIWRDRGVVPRLLQLMYLGSQEVLRYEPDEADLRATERQVLALAAAIRRAQETQDFRPNRSRLCDWCSHQALCPEFGGTPPPYPVMPVKPAPAAEDEVPSAFMPGDEV
jgi:putative RecB family exonuclease